MYENVFMKFLSSISCCSLVIRISLNNVKDEDFNVPPEFHLNLPKLRKLSISSCSFKILEFFDQLDDDLLDELHFIFISGTKTRKFFENQRKIKVMQTNENCNEILNLQGKTRSLHSNSVMIMTVQTKI
jgi:hypothetical protein